MTHRSTQLLIQHSTQHTGIFTFKTVTHKVQHGVKGAIISHMDRLSAFTCSNVSCGIAADAEVMTCDVVAKSTFCYHTWNLNHKHQPTADLSIKSLRNVLRSSMSPEILIKRAFKSGVIHIVWGWGDSSFLDGSVFHTELKWCSESDRSCPPRLSCTQFSSLLTQSCSPAVYAPHLDRFLQHSPAGVAPGCKQTNKVVVCGKKGGRVWIIYKLLCGKCPLWSHSLGCLSRGLKLETVCRVALERCHFYQTQHSCS